MEGTRGGAPFFVAFFASCFLFSAFAWRSVFSRFLCFLLFCFSVVSLCPASCCFLCLWLYVSCLFFTLRLLLISLLVVARFRFLSCCAFWFICIYIYIHTYTPTCIHTCMHAYIHTYVYKAHLPVCNVYTIYLSCKPHISELPLAREAPKPKLQNSEPSALQVPMPLSGAALQPAETAPQPAGERKNKRAKQKKEKKKRKITLHPCRLHAEMPLVNNMGRMATATKPCHKGRPLQTTSMRRASLIGMSTFMSATRTLRATQTPAWGQERALPTARPPNDVRRNARSRGVGDPLLPDCQLPTASAVPRAPCEGRPTHD